MTTLRSLPALIALALSSLCAPAFAEGELQLGTLVNATPIERHNPSYPVSAAEQLKEGWVFISFCIDVQGNVHTPVIERSSGVPEFERASLKAILRWKYAPARLNGEPVEQCQASFRLQFSMRGLGLGARPAFTHQWKAASRLINEANLAEAKLALDALIPHNNYESAYLAVARARVAENTGDVKQQLSDLRTALMQSESMEKSLRRSVRRRVFALELQQSDWAAAHETYAALADQVDELSESEKNAGAKLAALVTGDTTLATHGELECRCDKANGAPLWSAPLLRREFTFSETSGKIDQIELRCLRHRFSAVFEANKGWRVPEAWGQCTLYVFGEEGAKFKLVEMAPQVAAAEGAASAAKP